MAINIRKFVLQAHSLDELVALGTISPQAARFLEAAVASGLNILVSGGTQAGKTTLLGCSVGGRSPLPGSTMEREDSAPVGSIQLATMRLVAGDAMRIVLKVVGTPVAGFYPGPFGPGKVFMFSNDLDWQSIDGRPVQPGAPPEPLAARPNLRPTAAGTHSGLNRTLRIADGGDPSYAEGVEVFHYEATWALGAVTV